MSTIKKIIYDCRQATYLIEKRQETSLTTREKVRLLIHLAGCSVCRLFQRQSRAITSSLQGLFRQPKEHGHTLDEEFKRQLQDRINRQPPG